MRVLTCLAAHSPNAADTPAALISATMTPRMTRNTKMPAEPDSALMRPTLMTSTSAYSTGISAGATSVGTVPSRYASGLNTCPLMMKFIVSTGSPAATASKIAPTKMPTNKDV